MRSAIIKKASQDEQQNQTTITTDIKYIRNVSLFKFYAVTKKTTNRDNKQDFIYNLQENIAGAVKPHFAPQN